MNIFKSITGLFSKKLNTEDDNYQYEELDRTEFLEKSIDEKETLLAHSCEQVVDATFQMEDLQMEYELVNAYFTDVQRIETLPEMNKKEIQDVARKIILLEDTRMNFLKSETKMSDEDFKQVQSVEGDIKDIMGKLAECEARDTKIRRDMQHLEGEKASLEYTEEMIEEKLEGLKFLTIVIGVITAITLAIFITVGYVGKMDVIIPCLVTLLIATIAGVVLFLHHRNLVYEMKTCRLKYKRAIMLLNKVKIKYINNTNALEYLYDKYKVHSLKELQYMWERYVGMLDEIKLYQRNTGDLRVYCDELTKLLESVGVKDPEVWTKQTVAIIENREMNHVKKSLDNRRKKLRAQLEYNERIKENSLLDIQKIIEHNPEMKGYVKNALLNYNIEL